MRAKGRERPEARRLRRQGHSLREISREVGVALSSVSVWTRDVPKGEADPVVLDFDHVGEKRRGVVLPAGVSAHSPRSNARLHNAKSDASTATVGAPSSTRRTSAIILLRP